MTPANYPLATITAIALEAIAACQNHIQQTFDPSFTLDKVQLTFSPKFSVSRGGAKYNYKTLKFETYMRLTLNHYLRFQQNADSLPSNKKVRIYFTEYSHIAQSKEIGSLYGCTIEKSIWALIAHEIAHCLQFSLLSGSGEAELQGRIKKSILSGEFRPLKGRGKNKGDIHGALWQFIYHELRIKLVNEMK